MPENKGERILYADILRIIATFAIIVYHVSTDKWYGVFDDKTEWNIINIFVSGLKWGVPLFFMLSGMNFLDPNRNISVKKIYTKYIPHIVIALIFWGLLYKGLALSLNYINGSKEISFDNIKDIIYVIACGVPWMHLWFLYALLALYILTPATRIFTANASKKDFIYLLVMYIIFASLLPNIQMFTGIILSISVPDLIGYTGYFLAGYFLAKYDLSKTKKRILYILGIIMCIATIVYSICRSYQLGYPVHNFMFRYESLNILVMAYAIFVFAKDKINNSINFKQKYQNNKYIKTLSSCCFGIYLSHMIFFNLLQLLGLSASSFTAILSIPVCSIIIYTLSLITTLIIKRIPIIGKWVI